MDDVVVVQGSGPVGLFATAMLSKMPRAQLIVVGGPDDRLRVASDFGADATVSIAEYPDAESRRQAILELTGGSSPNRMFEMSGAPTAFSEGLELLARGGQYIIMGQVSGNQVMSRPGRITMKNLEIRGAFSGSVRHYKTALEFLRMHQEEIPFDRIISGRYQLDDVDVVMRRMRDQEEIKPVMIVD
ncbi:zinc-binding dehydrogenase [Spelaeicoccus albus]|uniref:Threonine dehydrogenase-like Zn-dependent dehydrogenase n=1 Tax=Spelaeicoccus albus TaxID=1280376 RepID=A0A7Z0D036_9MICO|nr:zinc-binding dehydrogenase [Spelaeicoccus albus]NYI66956.1 threonine dehydrogenase-like Zn-dependent dehydrogenase [Spelaeicoccus albus]